jgi:hypothetical protein
MSQYNPREQFINPTFNFIRVIKPRRKRRAGYLIRMREVRNAYKILVQRPEGRDHVRELGMDGRTILKCILQKKV